MAEQTNTAAEQDALDTEEQRRKRAQFAGAPARRGFGGLARDVLGGGDYGDLLGAAGRDLGSELGTAMRQAAGNGPPKWAQPFVDPFYGVPINPLDLVLASSNLGGNTFVHKGAVPYITAPENALNAVEIPKEFGGSYYYNPLKGVFEALAGADPNMVGPGPAAGVGLASPSLESLGYTNPSSTDEIVKAITALGGEVPTDLPAPSSVLLDPLGKPWLSVSHADTFGKGGWYPYGWNPKGTSDAFGSGYDPFEPPGFAPPLTDTAALDMLAPYFPQQFQQGIDAQTGKNILSAFYDPSNPLYLTFHPEELAPSGFSAALGALASPSAFLNPFGYSFLPENIKGLLNTAMGIAGGLAGGFAGLSGALSGAAEAGGLGGSLAEAGSTGAFNLAGTGPGVYSPAFSLGTGALSPSVSSVSPLGLTPLTPSFSPLTSAPSMFGPGAFNLGSPALSIPGGIGPLGVQGLSTPGFGGTPPSTGFLGQLKALQEQLPPGAEDILKAGVKQGAKALMGAQEESIGPGGGQPNVGYGQPQYPPDVALAGAGSPASGAGVAGSAPPPSPTTPPDEFEKIKKAQALASFGASPTGVSPYGMAGALPIPKPFGAA